MSTASSAARAAVERLWPPDGLEPVDACPYCGSVDREIGHEGVQDWSFYSAAGRWNYWSCLSCGSLHLSPRPTEATIAQAYGTYYTHANGRTATIAESVKSRLRNEYWSHRYEADIRPRIHLPRRLGWALAPLRSRILESFEAVELRRLFPGRLADVGCGNGEMLSLASHLGWSCVGLEIDPLAARVARERGAHVVDGSYRELASLGEQFDCIICSHVLEHVHDPRHLLMTLSNALKSGGTLLLATPNAMSHVRRVFGENWRGLEAPRHLTIPAMRQLTANLRALGFSVRARESRRPWTAAESSRISRRATRIEEIDRDVARRLSAATGAIDASEEDFCELVCVKSDGASSSSGSRTS